MAHLWFETHPGEWNFALLRDGAVALGTPPNLIATDQHAAGSALLLRSRTPAGEQWYLMNVSLDRLWVNGETLDAGIRALRNRDEIRGAAIGRVFFATEQQAVIEPFPGSDRVLLCPRCRTALSPGVPAVRCACGAVFHQDSAQELCCFDHGAACPLCGAPTTLGEDFRFQPAEL